MLNYKKLGNNDEEWKEEPTQNEHSEVLTQLAELYNENNQPKKFIPIALKSFLCLIAFNSGIPYIEPAKRFANNLILGYFFGFSVYLSIGSSTVWAVEKFSTYFELIQKTSKENKKPEVVLTITSLFLGAISSTPGALIALRYNSPWILPLSMFHDFSMNAFSFNELFRELYNDRFSYKNQHELLQWRDNLIQGLEYGVIDSNISNLMDEKKVIAEFQQVFASAQPKLDIQNDHPWVFKLGLNLTKNCLGIFLPLSWAIISVYLVYHDINNTLKFNKVAAIITALLTTLPTYFLEYFFAKSLTAKSYIFIANKFYGINNTNPVINFHPKLMTAFLMLTVTLVSCVFSLRAQVIMDLFKAGSIRNTLLILVSVASFIIKTSATIDNFFKIGNMVLARFTSQDIFNRQLLLEKCQIILRIAEPKAIEMLRPVFPEIKQPNRYENISNGFFKRVRHYKKIATSQLELTTTASNASHSVIAEIKT